MCWSVHSGHWVENGFRGYSRGQVGAAAQVEIDGDGRGRDVGGRGAKAWMDARVFPEINHDLWQ